MLVLNEELNVHGLAVVFTLQGTTFETSSLETEKIVMPCKSTEQFKSFFCKCFWE